MNTTFIYVLIDPNTNNVRYVGKSNDPKRRYYKHCFISKKNTHKAKWINKLLNEDKKPTLQIIDEVPVEEWIFWESYWISQFKAWGFNLTNHTSGGDGCTFANQTSFKKGNKSWNEGTRGVVKANSGSFKKGQISLRKGIVISEEIKEKIRSKNNCKIVLQYDKKMNLIDEHRSIELAAKSVNGCPKSISKVCNKVLTYHGIPYKSHKGFIWKFKEIDYD